MTKISFNNSVNAVSYGLMATLTLSNPYLSESSIPIPCEHYSFAEPLNNGALFTQRNLLEDYTSRGVITSLDNVKTALLSVINSITEQPTDLDIQMIRMLNHDVGDLF